jgi:hypothetical protein
MGVRARITNSLVSSGKYKDNLYQLLSVMKERREAITADPELAKKFQGMSEEERIADLLTNEGPDAVKHFKSFK